MNSCWQLLYAGVVVRRRCERVVQVLADEFQGS